jgi:hypothetical protein
MSVFENRIPESDSGTASLGENGAKLMTPHSAGGKRAARLEYTPWLRIFPKDNLHSTVRGTDG